jgi:preprotein translocase SecE subunit
MTKSESKVGTAIEPHSEEFEENGAAEAPRAHPARATEPERRPSAGGGVFSIVKPGQGIHVRWGTAIGVGLLAVAGAYWIYEQAQAFDVGEKYNLYFHTLLPVVLLLAAAYGIFYMVGKKAGVVDFLIATEGEMKKVNWSTRREVWGATRVVIVTVFGLALMLFVVDLVFMLFFGGIGVLQNVRLLQTFMGEAG